MMSQHQLTKQGSFRLNNQSGASLVEYVIFILIILTSLFVMKDVISQGVFSKYRQAGESLSFGRQYDAKRTVVCRQDVLSYEANGQANLGNFYDEDCFRAM